MQKLITVFSKLSISSRLSISKMGLCSVLLAGFLPFVSCATGSSTLEGRSAAIYFKAAENSRVQRRYKDALRYYKLIQYRFADHYTLVLEAEFSIAQLYYSWAGHNEQAKEHYANVIAFYDRPEIGSDVFPQSFLRLAKKNLQSLEKRSKFYFFPPKTYGVHSYPPEEIEE